MTTINEVVPIISRKNDMIFKKSFETMLTKKTRFIFLVPSTKIEIFHHLRRFQNSCESFKNLTHLELIIFFSLFVIHLFIYLFFQIRCIFVCGGGVVFLCQLLKCTVTHFFLLSSKCTYIISMKYQNGIQNYKPPQHIKDIRIYTYIISFSFA